MDFRRFSPVVLTVSLLATSLSGCGPRAEVRPDLHAVHGSLTVNGQPAEGAWVVFYPVDPAGFDSRQTRPKGVVDAAGKFQMTTYQQNDGVPAGDYQAAILWFGNPDSSSSWDKLAGRYADPKSTDLRFVIKAGDNTLPPIELKNVAVQSRRPARNPRDLDQVE